MGTNTTAPDNELRSFFNLFYLFPAPPLFFRNSSGGDALERSNARKLNEGKKRTWDEFLVTNKSGQEQPHDRRPYKRRQGNEGRNRRNNRNRHGNNNNNNSSSGSNNNKGATGNRKSVW